MAGKRGLSRVRAAAVQAGSVIRPAPEWFDLGATVDKAVAVMGINSRWDLYQLQVRQEKYAPVAGMSGTTSDPLTSVEARLSRVEQVVNPVRKARRRQPA